MSYTLVRSIISKIKLYNSPDHLVLLGRWQINDCNKTRNIKIDMANEDHCGSCSHYRLKQIMRNKLADIRKNNLLK